MTDRIDASMHQMESTLIEFPVNRVLTQPGSDELATSHDSVLTGGELSDPMP